MLLYRLTTQDAAEGLAALVVPLDARPAAPEPFAGVLNGNLLGSKPPALPARIPAGRLIAWSGTMAEDDMFRRDVRTWMPGGLEAFRAMCARVRPALEATGAQLLFRPHARHVLCDPQRCLTLVREWRDASAPFALALESTAMLEETMLAQAEDHLERAFAALGPLAEVVILANVAPSDAPPGDDEEDAPALLQVPLHSGAIDPTLILDAWRRHTPPSTPLILSDSEIEIQRRLLGPMA